MTEKKTPAIRPNAAFAGQKPAEKVKKARKSSAAATFQNNATRQDAAKRTAAVSVYLTPEDRRAFRLWAFERELSMSDVLAEKVHEILHGQDS